MLRPTVDENRQRMHLQRDTNVIISDYCLANQFLSITPHEERVKDRCRYHMFHFLIWIRSIKEAEGSMHHQPFKTTPVLGVRSFKLGKVFPIHWRFWSKRRNCPLGLLSHVGKANDPPRTCVPTPVVQPQSCIN